MCGRFGCHHFKTEWFTGLKVDINIYRTDSDADVGSSILMAPVMVGDHVTTQVVPLAISTTCAARASIKD